MSPTEVEGIFPNRRIFRHQPGGDVDVMQRRIFGIVEVDAVKVPDPPARGGDPSMHGDSPLAAVRQGKDKCGGNPCGHDGRQDQEADLKTHAPTPASVASPGGKPTIAAIKNP